MRLQMQLIDIEQFNQLIWRRIKFMKAPASRADRRSSGRGDTVKLLTVGRCRIAEVYRTRAKYAIGQHQPISQRR